MLDHGRLDGERGRIRRELEEELETHIEMRTEELIAAGMSPTDARHEAERRFGDMEAARRDVADRAARRARREQRAASAWALWRSVRHAGRQLRRSPGFAVASILIFAGAVGLTTATFTLVDHVLLRPLPFPRPEQLVVLQGISDRGVPVTQVSMANWVDWKQGAATLAGTALIASQDVTVLAREEAFWAPGATVSGDLFGTVGMPVELGRPLTEADGQERAPVVAISHDLWVRVFGGEPDLESLSLTVNGRRREVVAVVPDGHAFPGGTDLWIPVPYDLETAGSRNNINYEAVARLRPDATIERAREELTSIALGILDREPDAIYSHGVHVRPLQDQVVGAASDWLRLLIGAVACVLLVACANLAGLSLARGRRRERDIAVRLALGGSRAQLGAERLAEHVLSAGIGGGLGLLLSWAGTGALLRAFGAHLPRSAEVTFDTRIAAAGLLASLAAGVVAGLAPALRRPPSLAAGLSSGARGGVRGGRGLPGAVMVGTEVALAVALLVGAGLLLRSLLEAAARDLGYDAEDVLVLDIALTAPEYGDLDARMRYWDALLDALRAQPGVAAVGLGNWIPTGGAGTSFIELEGRAEPDVGAGYRVVSDDYLEAMDIPLLAGRGFEASDAFGTERVGLVNRTAAERFWPEQDALGQRIKAPSMEAYYNGGTADWITVIGVTGDVRHFGFERDPMPELFVLHRQVPAWTGFMSAVAELGPGAGPGVAEGLTRSARSLDGRLAVQSIPLSARVRGLLSERRLILGVLGVFTAAALGLVCLGIYSLVSLAVAERTREIAVRAALGAARERILADVLGGALRVVAAGAAVGLVAALALRPAVDALVFGVATTDAVTYAFAAAFMVTVALLASLLPALRAARLDPLEALRREG